MLSGQIESRKVSLKLRNTFLSKRDNIHSVDFVVGTR